MYFVTICTKDKEHCFGKIINQVETNSNLSLNQNSEILNGEKNIIDTHNSAYLRMAEIGKIAHEFWLDIPNHYPFVILDEFVVMPNHIHGIIIINKENYNKWNPNQFGKQSGNLGAIIRSFKASVKRYANQNDIEFHWQPRYHDHIIRDKDSYLRIKKYIISNPQNWHKDTFNK